MSIALICTAGYGNGSIIGSITDIATAGYAIGDVVVTPDSTFGVYGRIDANGQGTIGLINPDGQGTIGHI